MAMAADANGKSISLVEMRRRFPLSLKGARRNEIIRISQGLGFSTRALRLDLDAIGRLRLPCILHWDLNHFLVLKKVGGRKITIVDPACGERSMAAAEFSRHFTGVALELTPLADFKPELPAPRVTLRQLTGSLQGVKRALVQVLVLSIALQLFLLISPFFMQ